MNSRLKTTVASLPPIVDTHLHFWDLGAFRYPWLHDPGCEHLRQNYLPPDWQDDAANLEILARVHVQAEIDHDHDPVEETRWLNRIAPATPATVCVGYADLRDRRVDEVLARHAETPMFRGIRQEAWFDPDSRRADVPKQNLLDSPEWRKGLRRLSSHSLSFDLLVWPSQLDQARVIFREIPDLPVILEHTGLPPLSDFDGLTRWRTSLRAFARQVPQAFLKLSGMSLIEPCWSPDRIAPIIREAIDIFGPDRCMLGSNFPLERATLSYSRLWGTYGEMLAHLDAKERDAVFFRTAAAVYRIDV